MKKTLFMIFFVAFVVFLGCVNKYFNLKIIKEHLKFKEIFGLKEGFTVLNPGNYKCSDVLLDGSYKVNTKEPMTSCETYESQSRLYPVI